MSCRPLQGIGPTRTAGERPACCLLCSWNHHPVWEAETHVERVCVPHCCWGHCRGQGGPCPTPESCLPPGGPLGLGGTAAASALLGRSRSCPSVPRVGCGLPSLSLAFPSGRGWAVEWLCFVATGRGLEGTCSRQIVRPPRSGGFRLLCLSLRLRAPCCMESSSSERPFSCDSVFHCVEFALDLHRTRFTNYL